MTTQCLFISGNTLRLFQYYIRGIFSIYYNITWGRGVFPIYYNITIGGGGVCRDPKFVLRNKWTAPIVEMKNIKLGGRHGATSAGSGVPSSSKGGSSSNRNPVKRDTIT